MAESPRPSLFDERPELYEALVDWPKRLAREGPFFRRLFDEHGVGTVLDAACGTGQHAALFASWGLTVEGADISAAMIERCRAQFGESDRLRWRVRGFESPPERPGAYDAVICIGNSLSLAPDGPTTGRAVASMAAALRPGGVGIIQVLNLWAIPEGPTQWTKSGHRDQERVILKGLHRHGAVGLIDIIDVRRGDDGMTTRIEGPTFQGLSVKKLREMIGAAGGNVLGVFGDYYFGEYRLDQSSDLIVTFTRAGAVMHR